MARSVSCERQVKSKATRSQAEGLRMPGVLASWLFWDVPWGWCFCPPWPSQLIQGVHIGLRATCNPCEGKCVCDVLWWKCWLISWSNGEGVCKHSLVLTKPERSKHSVLQTICWECRMNPHPDRPRILSLGGGKMTWQMGNKVFFCQRLPKWPPFTKGFLPTTTAHKSSQATRPSKVQPFRHFPKLRKLELSYWEHWLCQMK